MRACRWMSLVCSIVFVPLTVVACAGDSSVSDRPPPAATAAPTAKPFDEALAGRLQAVLEAAVAKP
jgi:hypothetical protein